MRLIQLGRLVMNMDLVTRIEDLTFVTPAGTTEPGPIRIEFDLGNRIEVLNDADALRAWLATNVSVVALPPAP